MIVGPGQRLGERYVLEDRLAVGGMGEVWRGRDDVLNRPVAVKILRLELAPEVTFQARFRAEARTAAALSHGGIAAVYDYGEAQGSAYLVMELVPGEPLSAMIAREGALGTDRTLTIVAQAARALHAAHLHGVVHRDIKPANLMITPELRVKITDFGISRPRDHEPLTATGQVMGTAHYLAPELARGEVATALSDVYALGVVTYECLAGWRPFEGDNQVAVATAQLTEQPPPLPETVPQPVRRLVEAAMSKNPASRPQGAKELAVALEDLRLRRLAGAKPSGGGNPGGGAGGWPADAETPPGGGATRLAPRANPGGAGGFPTAGVANLAPGASTRPPSARQSAAHGAQTPQAPDAPHAPQPRRAPQGRSGAGPRHPAQPGRSGQDDEQLNGMPPVRRSGPPTASMPDRGTPTGAGTDRGGFGGGLAGAFSGGRPSRRITIPLLALAVLLGLVVLMALLGNPLSDDDPEAGSTPRPGASASTRTGTATTAPQTSQPLRNGAVVIVAADFVGKDRKVIRRWFEDNQVTYEFSRQASQEPKGTVIDITPTGRVELGETVVVTYSTGPG
jgi:serine/threonine protein kinase